MKFLIIGSNSFSGSHFVNEVLKRNHTVLGVSRSPQPKDVFLPYKWKNYQETVQLKDKFRFLQLDLNNDLEKIIDLINK